MWRRLAYLSVLVVVAALTCADAAVPIQVMILDGESGGPYHKWQLTTPLLKRVLDETGLFSVDVVTAPTAGADFAGFDPHFSRYRTIVLNYDAPDDRWPAALKASFENFIRDGGGLLVVHAADNAFPDWPAYNEMTGVGGWRSRNESAGPYWYVKDGRAVSDATAGPAGSHGARTPYAITVLVPQHPILKGLPLRWMHQADELYAHLRGPGKNMTILATAYSDPANKGSGRDEPQLMTLTYGKGRVFHMTLGHDINGMSSVDFVTLLQRGTEWVATGAVTQPAPPAFPTADTVSYRTDLAAMDPGYTKGFNPLDEGPHR